MKVVHCSTGVSFSSANYRIHLALIKSGIHSEILTLYKNPKNMLNVHDISEYGKKYAIHQRCAYYFNILEFYYLDKIAGLMKGMPFTTGKIGVNICEIPLIREADIIHIHCVNAGFLGFNSIRKIIKLNKPIIITLHDSWFLTGGCHVLNGCSEFENGCANCKELKHLNRISESLFKEKSKLLSSEIVLTAPSRWTYYNIKKSKLLSKNKSYIIGNTLDFEIFSTIREQEVCEILGKKKKSKKIKLLFGALNSTITPYKGFSYLVEALNEMLYRYPEIAQNVELNIFGANEQPNSVVSKFQYTYWGYISDERKLAAIYNYCDIYVVPSLEDSFNQTVLESCACGTPVVSFRTGGICDIIQHKKTGYLAKYKDSKDLLHGILWMLDKRKDIGNQAQKYVRNTYSQKEIAYQFIRIYEETLKDYK